MTQDTAVLSDLIDFMVESMGINPMVTYCQFTGKPMGRLYQEEIEDLLPESFTHDDLEEMADDLMVRTLASMRPSVYWNVMREDSILKAMSARPLETLAYLLNRLFQPADYIKLQMGQRLNDLHGRIRLYAFLSEYPQDKRDSLFSMLIEIDAKMNLSQQRIDLRVEDFMLFNDEAMEAITDWYESSIKRWKRNQTNEENSARWFKGATLARPAFVRSWLDAKPESKTAKGKRIKSAEDSAINNLFASVMAEVESNPILEAEPAHPAIPQVRVASTKLPSFLQKKVA